MDTMSYLLGKNSSSSGGGSSAGSDFFVINGRTMDGKNYTIDKTYSEIEEADQEGKILFLKAGSFKIFLNFLYNMETQQPYFGGFALGVFKGNLVVDEIAITSDNKITVTKNVYTLTPSS